MADRPPPHVTPPPHTTRDNHEPGNKQVREKPESGSKTGLYLIIGGLVLAAIVAFFIFSGDDADDVNVTTEGGESAVEGAADDTGDAIEGAADETGDAVEGTADAVEDAVDPDDTQTGD